MTTSLASISPRLISAVSSDPAALLATAAAELARRWIGGNYELGLADDGVASQHAAKRAVEAGNTLGRAAGELARALDRSDAGSAW
jgi:hypothetical protein